MDGIENRITTPFSARGAHAADSAEVAAAKYESLLLRNGYAAPLDAVPVLSLSKFSHSMWALVLAGCRVCAFFALPASLLPRADVHDGDSHCLAAVLADDTDGIVHIIATQVGPSYLALTPRIPAVHLFEREIYEQSGIIPEGHPWLKPVRFESPGVPVGSMDFYRVGGDEVHEVAVGPIHAGVIECGHFRFQCLGEVVMHLEISLGYHHRGLAHLLASGGHASVLPLMEAVAGDSTIAHTWAYCSVAEGLGDAAPLPRGQLVRALALELERLANHTGDLGALAGDVGFLSTMSYCGRLRGDWLNMSAMLCGSRFGRGLVVPGGAAFDVDKALAAALRDKIVQTGRDVQGALRLMWDSPSVMARFTGIGAVPRRTAQELGLVGPAARASGLEVDARVTHPLPGLPQPPEAVMARQGDVHARAAVRHAEISASVAFCLRLLDSFLTGDDGGHEEPTPGEMQPLMESNIAVALVEGWRGEVCHVGITGPDGAMAAYRIVDPSFHNWMGLAMALRGQQISDFPLCNKSFNLSYCGHDL